jgi:hypothetical protein
MIWGVPAGISLCERRNEVREHYVKKIKGTQTQVHPQPINPLQSLNNSRCRNIIDLGDYRAG